MKKLYPALFLLLGCALQENASAQFRTYSNEFLNIGAGARGLAMGSAQIASVNDGTATYWNPSALVNIKGDPQLNIMHAEYFAGIGKYDFASLALPLKDGKRTVGISVLRFAVDDIPNTVFLVEPDGTLNFSNITTFSSADYAFLFSFAQQVKIKKIGNLNMGFSAKIIHRKAGDFATSWGFGFDAAAQYVSKRLKLGVVARDVTTTFNAWSYKINEPMREVFYLTNNEIPAKSTELTAPQLIIGAAYKLPLGKSLTLMPELNLGFTFDGRRNTVLATNIVSADPRIGLELGVKDVFFVRGGINNFQRALEDEDSTNTKKVWIYQPAVGAGFKISNVMIDYAFTNLANQSNPLYTHVFSLKLNMVKTMKKKKK